MKIRAGYVSNSSSSSFLVRIPTDFEITLENVHRLMFNCDDNHPVEVYGDPMDSHDLAAIVTNDLLNNPKNDINSISNELKGEGGPNWDDFRPPVSERDSEKYLFDHKARTRAENIYGEMVTEKYMEAHPGVDTYVLSYGDEGGGAGSILEHGGYLGDFSDRFSHH